MANFINMVSKNSAGKVVNQNIPHINPEASDADIKTFVKTLGALSDNTLVAAQKIVARDIDRAATEPDEPEEPPEPPEPPVTIVGTSDADNLYSDKYGAIITISDGKDSISLDGAVKNEVHLSDNDPQCVYIYNDAHDNSIYSGRRAAACYYSSVTGGNVFISQNFSDSIYGYSDNDSIFIDRAPVTIVGEYDKYGKYQVAHGIVLPSVPACTRLQIFDAEGNRISIGTEKDGEYFVNPIIVGNGDNDTSFSSKPFTAITNSGDNVTISGAYANTISNSGDLVQIIAKYNEIITNSGSNVIIATNKTNSTASLTSSISTSGNDVTVACRRGGDFVTLAGQSQMVSIDSGAPSVSGFKAGDSIRFYYRFTDSIDNGSDITLNSRGSGNLTSSIKGSVVLQGIYDKNGERPEIVIMDSVGAQTIPAVYAEGEP